jgi:o-succinylbenzoate synthase
MSATVPGGAAARRDGTAPLAIGAVELVRIDMPLVSPFRTSFGTSTRRSVLLVHVLAGDSEGWGECVAMEEPLYSSEYLDAAQRVITDHLLPRLFATGGSTADDVAAVLAPVKGHRMAKAAVEMAWLDAELRRDGVSFAARLGAVRDRVVSGVSVGIMATIPQLLDAVSGYLAEGYARIKLKIEPGWDIDPVRAVRQRFGDDVLLQVDANTAYTLDDADHLARLDEFDLLLIEQPLPEEQLLAHARLAGRLRTPICLDESIVSAVVAEEAIELGACRIVNIKPGRAGGYLEAVRIHDVCRRRDVPVWCGGMLETGVGRAANVALAALPGFTLPGDTSASDRYYARDITAPFTLGSDGCLPVPQGPGLGVDVRRDVLDELTTATQVVRATG